MKTQTLILLLELIYERLNEERPEDDICNDYKLDWYLMCIEDLKKIVNKNLSDNTNING